MKQVIASAMSFGAALVKLALTAAATAAPPISSAHIQAVPTGRSRQPGKPGKAGDKMARHAKENRLGVRS